MQADIEKFYNAVAQNPALLARLTTTAGTPEEFIDGAVKEAKAQGFSITHEEARSWIDGQIAARQNGELTDVQLERVAGGKGGDAALAGMDTIAQGINSTFGGMVNPIISGVSSPQFKPVADGLTSAKDWFSSW
jgi:predicted ribosomally synthesized peptide with nif11-like leader